MTCANNFIQFRFLYPFLINSISDFTLYLFGSFSKIETIQQFLQWFTESLIFLDFCFLLLLQSSRKVYHILLNQLLAAFFKRKVPKDWELYFPIDLAPGKIICFVNPIGMTPKGHHQKNYIKLNELFKHEFNFLS